MNEVQALAAIQKRGFLNEFSTPLDTWFVAHSVPAGDSADAVTIPTNIALQLIHVGAVSQAGRGTALSGASCRTAWYRAAAKHPKT